MNGTLFGAKRYTLSFDGSHNNQDNKAGAGCTIRDSRGELVIAAAYNLTETYPHYCDVAIAEAEALKNGLSLAKQKNLYVYLIKGDSKEVIDHVLGRSRRPARPLLSKIIQQIVGMFDRFSQEIVLVDREANKVADKLAFWGSTSLQGSHMIYTTYADLPPQVAGLIRQEKSDSSTTEDEGESSSLASKLGKVGAAVAGAAVVGWGVLKLFNELSSDYQQQPKYKKSPWNSIDPTHNHSSESSQHFDHYTLNYSGSDINQLHKGGAGCIIRNKQGDLVIAAAYNLDYDQFHVAIAEAIAWIRGLELAKTKKVKLDLIKGDNEEVINRVRGREKKSPQVPSLSDYINEIREGLNEQSIDPESQVSRIKSEDNEIANELASLGSKLESGLVQTYRSDEELPNKVAMLIEQDKYKLRAQKFLM